MKYITGHTFKIGMGQKKTPSLLQQMNIQKQVKGDENFKTGVTYSIYNIQPSKDNVKYTFIDHSINRMFEVDFKDIASAEQKIAKFAGGV